MTDQGIQLLGMLTEAIHTPFIQDRALSIENAKYIFNNARHLSDEIVFKKDGKIQKRADEVLDETLKMLQQISNKGLIKAVEEGMFADISRLKNGGKGAEGVIKKSKDYYNPLMEIIKEELRLNE
jgi:beta-lysine 5,6-aminomutase alpha subunit